MAGVFTGGKLPGSQGPGVSFYHHQLRANTTGLQSPFLQYTPFLAGGLGMSPLRGRQGSLNRGHMKQGYWARSILYNYPWYINDLSPSDVQAMIAGWNYQIVHNNLLSSVPWEFVRPITDDGAGNLIPFVTDHSYDTLWNLDWSSTVTISQDSNLNKTIGFRALQFSCNPGKLLAVRARFDSIGGSTYDPTQPTMQSELESRSVDGTWLNALVPEVAFNEAATWGTMLFFDCTWEEYQAAFGALNR